jgi:hypothetical protein
MELSGFAEALRAELTAITRLAGDDVARAAELLAEALEPSIQLTLLDVLSAAAAEITDRLRGTVVEVRLARGEPTFVVHDPGLQMPLAPEPLGPEPAGTADAGVARMTLRLPENLKARVEAAASREGVSVNTWLSHAIRRALEAPTADPVVVTRPGPGQRITGFARG